MKNLKHTNGIRIALFATFLLLSSLNLSAQYKLELGWQKDTEWITSITKSDNDSLLYVAFQNLIVTIKTSDGSIVKSDSVDGDYNLILSRDGNTLVASSGTGVGLLDPQTFKQIYFEYTPMSDFRTLSFNEKANKYLICGPSGFIKVYDINTKSLFKEFKTKYSVTGDILLRNARLTDDGKYIIYSYVTNVQKFKNYLTIMDLEGNIVKEFLETSSTQFTFTNNGKTLIYFMPDAIHFFGIETMKEEEGISLGGLNPVGIEKSNDNKFMLIGGSDSGNRGLRYCDLGTKKTFWLYDNGYWENFNLNSNNSSLFLGVDKHLYRFNIVPNTSIKEDQNKLEWTIQVNNNDLIITSTSEINPTYKYHIVSNDGKIVKQFLLNEIQSYANHTKINIIDLKTGAYILQITDNNKTVFSTKFIKVN